MNTQEKINLAANTRQLSLHREGIFYKLYNQHAMLFTENVTPLKIKSRFIKVVNQQVYSCGFPMTIIEDVKKQLCAIGGELDASEKLLVNANVKWVFHSSSANCRTRHCRSDFSRENCGLELKNSDDMLA